MRKKRSARGAVTPHPDGAVFDARPTRNLAHLLDYSALEVFSVASNGDCLYRCVLQAAANQSDLGKLNVGALRKVVADAVDESTFAVVKCASQDDALIRNCKDVAAFKELQQVEGAHAGAGKCLWASDFAIHTLANTFGLAFFIVNMESKSRVGRFCVVWPERGARTVAQQSSVRAVFLLRDRNGQHYDFFRVNGKGVLLFSAIPHRVAASFSHCLEPMGLLPGGATETCAAEDGSSGSSSRRRRRAQSSSRTRCISS